MDHALRIEFDVAIDGGSWPPPRAAEAGAAALGPLRLLERLETELGLGARKVSSSERVAALATAIAGRDGWWRASYDVDPRGTCARLLHDRDLLALWGWRGEPVSPRLAALWAATADAAPGVADRLDAIVAALRPGRTAIGRVETLTPTTRLEPSWARMFDALAAAGVAIEHAPRPPSQVAPDEDLARLRGAGARPRGDGSVALLRCHGPLAAADEVAASLAARAAAVGLGGVVVIGGDAVLDDALARHGLPRLGGAGRAAASTALVRFVVELLFEPAEPAAILGMLSLPRSPIARRVAYRLRRAFAATPSRRSPAWRAALAEGLAACDEAWRDDATASATLLAAAAPRLGEVEVVELDRRLGRVAAWAMRGAERQPSLYAVARRAAAAQRLLALRGARSIDQLAARRLCDELDAEDAGPAEAGLAAVDDPGGIIGPAEVVIWWGFTRDRAPRAPRLRLTLAERAALRACGLRPPDLGALMEDAAARWRRPLEQASHALVLVSPATDVVGEASFPHPLWDELRASLAAGATTAALEVTRLTRPAPAARIAVAPLPLPRPQPELVVPRAFPPRATESPSSLDKLLGCSLAWALEYHGGVRASDAADGGEVSPLLLGKLAHALVAEVFAGGALPAATAEAHAAALVDARLVDHCEVLALPRYQADRAALARAVVAAARRLAELITAAGATLRGFEVDLAGTVGGISLGGKADVVLDDPAAVIDLKWGRSKYVKQLESGTALQLATYAALLAVGGAAPEVAYLSLARTELLGPPGTTLPGAVAIGATTTPATWAGALVAIRRRQAEVAVGRLLAPGATGISPAADLGVAADGALRVAPPCGYCALDVLCGRGGWT